MSVPQLQQLKTKLLYFLNKFTIKKNMQIVIAVDKYNFTQFEWAVVNNYLALLSEKTNVNCKMTYTFDKPIIYVIINTNIQSGPNSNFATVNIIVNNKLVQKQINIPYVTGSYFSIPTLQLFAGNVGPTNKIEIEIVVISGVIMIGSTTITYLQV